MKNWASTIFLGVVIALPLIFFLDLNGSGAISLILFISVGLVFLFKSLFTAIFKNKKELTNEEDNNRDQ